MMQVTMWMGVSLVVAFGCDIEVMDDTEDLGAVTDRELDENGFRLNGFRLNGFRLNGFRLNGFRLNGDAGTGDYIEIERIELAGGGTVETSWLEASDLHVRRTDGVVLSGSQLTGAIIHFGMQEGGGYKNLKLRIAAVTALAAGSDVLQYNMQIKDAAGMWQPLCIDDTGQPRQAILINEAWEPATGSRLAVQPSDVVTPACRGAALAKCVEWGYLPWELPDVHQACTRAVRADYCGDGVSHTVGGVLIHVLDQLGIQNLEPGATYAVEAEWGTDGATCLDPLHTRLAAQTIECSPAACGVPFASGGVIQTGVPTP